jgi:hypothetical protein
MRKRLFINLLIISVAIFTLSYYGYTNNYSIENQVAIGQLSNNKTQDSTNSSLQVTQQEPIKTMGVKINYPIANQEVPVGKLNISGSSTDTTAEDCTVFADVNDFKPFQNATATGPGGKSDYSNWTFAYTEKYRLITEGNNELTAKLTCNGNNLANNDGTSNTSNEKSKWYSINVTGTAVQTPVKNDQNQTQNQDQTQPASSTQEQKIAILNEKELTTPPEESTKSINEVAPETESSAEATKDEEETLDKFSPRSEPKEEGVRNAESVLPSYPITEDRVSASEILTEGKEQESIIPQSTETDDLPDEDLVGTQLMYGGEDINDIKPENEEPLSMQDGDESQLQAEQEQWTESPVEIYELPDGDEIESQPTDNEGSFNDIKSENEESSTLQDDEEMKIQPPLQFFDSDNPEQGTEGDEQQIIHSDDNKIQNSQELYSMITGNSNGGDYTRDMVEDGQEEDSENVIEKEIPLVQSYSEDIKDVIEQNHQ